MNSSLEEKLFLPRPGEGMERYLDVLTSPPEYLLEEAAKERVLNFEGGLFEGRVLSQSADTFLPAGERPSLKDLLELVAKAEHVTLAYFLSDEGRATAREEGLDDIALAVDEQGLAQLLTVYSFEKPGKLKQKVLGKANKWVRNSETDAILNNERIEPYHEAYFLPNPQDFAAKVRGLLAYSAFFRRIKRELKEHPETPETSAKHAIVEIYQTRINTSLADEYPTLQGFTAQVRQLSPEYGRQWNQWLGTDFSSRLRLLMAERDISLNFVKRLDALRNGLTEGYGRDNSYRGVSGMVQRYYENEEAQVSSSETVFTEEEVAVLSEIEIDTATMQTWLEEVLKERGLLSEYTYDIEKDRFRKGRAPDKKWQIAVDPGTSSLSVDKIKGLIKLSDDFNRSLTSVEPVGAVPVGAHELMHVEQNERSYRNPYALRLTREISGKRATLLREASGILKEKEVHANLFGQYRPNNPHYMRALLTLEQTEDETMATQAFIESVLSGMELNDLPEKQRRATVYKAVDRVRRLTHRNGGFNTQPMVYAEQAIIAEEVAKLPSETQQLIFAEASLDLPDMVRLHRFGLLSIDAKVDRPLPDIFIEKVIPFMKEKLKEAKHEGR
jgi:hypothetical protein